METIGFDGQVNARSVSKLLAIARPDIGTVAGPSDRKVTAPGGARQIQIAGGRTVTGFILGTDPSAIALPAITAPAQGRYYLICDEVSWRGKSITPVILPGPTTTTTAPTTIPAKSTATGFRGLSVDDVGADIWHVPLAWIWVRQSDNTVVIWDLRILRSGMPAQTYGNEGVFTYERGGSGYDSWGKTPAFGLLASNAAAAERLDMPAGVYDIGLEFSVGSTIAAIGYLRVDVNGVNLSKDVRNDVGAQNLWSWNRPIVHPGGRLLVEVKALVARPDGGDVSGTVQNGTGFLNLAYRRPLNRSGF